MNYKDKKYECSHFPGCGGCTILDKGYESQIASKCETLKSLFSKSDIEIPPVLPSPEPFFYRHKVQLPFGSTRKSRIVLGCYASHSHSVVDQKMCLIQDRDLTSIASSIRQWALKSGLTPYNEKGGSGFLRHVLLRKGAGTGQILIGLVTNGDRPPGTRAMASGLLDIVTRQIGENCKIAGIVQNVNLRKTNVVLGQKEYTWWGSPFLKEKLGSLKFKVGLSTFFQVNPFQTPVLYNEVLRWISPGSGVIDLYSGTGSIALWIASHASKVIGIEENRASVEAARNAASLNGIKNAKFMAGDVSDLFEKLDGGEFDQAVIDPPRKGFHPQFANQLKVSALKRIIYVSCNPQSLVRDIDLLSPSYRLVSVQGVDMFPHTDHLECVAVMERR